MFFHKISQLGFIALFLMVSNITQAAVTTINASGFSIRIEEKVNVDRETAFNKFLNISKWWNAEHTWFGSSENLRLDNKAGGCFCETDGKSSVLHMTVSAVIPPQRFTMLGGLGPLQGMGLNGALTFTFEKKSANTTLIVQEYVVSGHNLDGFETLAGIVDNVQRLQMEGLVKYINGKN